MSLPTEFSTRQPIARFSWALYRHFGAKPDQKICRRSGGHAEFMEDPLHGRLNGIVVEIDGLWIVCAARGSEWLSGGEQGFDGFVVEDEERGHRLETGLHRLVAAGVADPADDVLAAEFLQIIGGGAGTVSRICLGCMSCGGGNRGKSPLVAQR